jgi:Holliday junction DNA helicase RuvA
MIFSIQGTITHIRTHDIIVFVQGISYQILVARPSWFKVNQEQVVFTYQVFREDDQFLVGFSTLEEKDVFLQLISVKGIGPKTALGMLTKAEPKTLIEAINKGEVLFLKSLPGIGPKAASQIILDLKGKLIDQKSDSKPMKLPPFIEAKDALRQLGFKASEIDAVLSPMSIEETSTEVIVKKALKLLGKAS